MPRRSIALKAAAALIALLLMAMSCDPYYDLRVSGQNGRVTIDDGPAQSLPVQSPFLASTTVRLTPVPDDGFEFLRWEGDAATSQVPLTIELVGDVIVEAVFGRVDPPPSLPTAPPPQQAILRIDVTPDDASWTVRSDAADGDIVAIGSGDDALGVVPSTYHLTGRRSLYADATDVVTLADGDDVTVALRLTRQYQLAVQGSDGGVLVDGAPHDLPFQGTYLAGSKVQLQADPDAGYAFASWSGSLSSVANPIVVTMDDDVTLTATFIDVAPPYLAILDPTDGDVTTVAEIEVTGTAYDDETTVETIEARRTGGPWSACQRPTTASFRCLVTDLPPDVTSVIEVRAVDAEGNDAVASVTVRYEPPPPSQGYDIDIVYFGETFSASQKAVFATAAARWQEVVVGDLMDARVVRPVGGSCYAGEPALDRTVDDLLIFATSFTDGPGGVLGAAGPCVLRGGSYDAGVDAGTVLVGIMQFDTADLDSLEASGLLDEVIVHEMGHVLGLGSLWEGRGLLDFVASDGATSCRNATGYTVDPTFRGASGVTAWQDDLGGFGYVPVENDGSSGTRCGHWDETIFDTELMTGYLNGADQPLSVLSVRSLEDLGLTVDPAAADPYLLPSGGALRTQGLFDIAGAETVLTPRGTVDPETGRFEPLR